jgi:hypothetical protein
MRKEFMATVVRRNENEVSQFMSKGCPLIDRAEDQISECKEVQDLQRLMMLTEQSLDGNGPDKLGVALLSMNVKKLYTDIVIHIMKEGKYGVTEKWSNGILSVGDAIRMGSTLSAAAHTAVAVQMQDTKSIWKPSDLNTVREARVDKEVNERLMNVTRPAKNNKESFMVWVLEVAMVAMTMYAQRNASPLVERAWIELARKVRLETPAEWQANWQVICLS